MDSEGFVVEWIGEEFGLGVRVVFVVLVVTTDLRAVVRTEEQVEVAEEVADLDDCCIGQGWKLDFDGRGIGFHGMAPGDGRAAARRGEGVSGWAKTSR